MSSVAIGSRVRLTNSGTHLTVVGEIGEGAQGTVYRAVADGGGELALKWYAPTFADIQRPGLERLISLDAPDGRFLWPIGLAEQEGTAGLGYAMPLVPPGWHRLVDRVAGRVDLSFRVIATIGYELADAFLALHSRGLCYRDVSLGNAFFDAATGAICICDNDNVTIDGDRLATVLGTPYFMAPEILRGEALPSAATDRYSLAVLLFFLLMIHHPLEGARAERMWDSEAMLDLFGREPVFLFDPDDPSNRPVPGLHENVQLLWTLYPESIRARFTQSFTVGLTDALNGRVSESVWRSAMIGLRDSIAFCAHCGRQNPTEADALDVTCWSCGRSFRVPPRIVLNRRSVVLNHDARLHRHHLALDYNFDDVVADVTQHPSDPSIWGLRNQSTQPWRTVGPDGATHEVPSGRSVTLIPGTEIDFDPGLGISGRIVG